MLFQLRTDNHLPHTQAGEEGVRQTVTATLGSRFGDRLRRVEVYLEDTNAHKGGAADIRCTIEVHLAGRPATSAEARASDVDTAIDGAVERVQRALERQLGKQDDRAGHTSAAGDEQFSGM